MELSSQGTEMLRAQLRVPWRSLTPGFKLRDDAFVVYESCVVARVRQARAYAVVALVFVYATLTTLGHFRMITLVSCDDALRRSLSIPGL